MPPLQRNTRRAVPRRTHRRLHALAATERVGMVFPSLAGVWSAQRVKIIALVLALLIGGTLFEFFNSDLFYAYGFSVTGVQFLTEAEVERASGVIGYNIFFVDARSVEQALRKLPEVKAAHVATGLPNQVAIQVEERVPEITWLRGTESYWLDQDGLVFRARANLTELPSIRDLDQAVVKPGQPIQSNAFAAYNGLRAAWPGAPRAFEWSGARGLAYTDEHGWKIYLGDPSEMAGKLAKLRALVPQLVSQNARITFIDLSKGDPFYQ
jgi:cell division septal protein FtsQ